MTDISIPVGDDTVFVVRQPRSLAEISELARTLRRVQRTTLSTSLCDAARWAGFDSWTAAQDALSNRKVAS